MIRAAVLTIIPTVDMIEIILMILCFLWENKYRRAIKKAVLNSDLFNVTVSVNFQYFRYNPVNRPGKIPVGELHVTDFLI